MKILVSNDDSVHAHGLKVLAKALSKIGDVTVVAPLEEKSTTGHSLTLHKPLRLLQMSDKMYGVSGSPADCVYVAIQEVLKGKKPDLVVSGINRGANLGQDVYYSGTVSAAREACILGIPSLAVSLNVDFKKRRPEEELYYQTAAKLAVKVIRKNGWEELPKYTLLNLNVPDLPSSKIKGIRVSRQGFRHYGGSILKRVDHRGKPYFWVGGEYKGYTQIRGTDCYEIEKGYATLTPLELDCTDHGYLERLAEVWPD